MDREKQPQPAILSLVEVNEDKHPATNFVELRPGQTCPRCGKGKLDYDGTLNLACPQCWLALSGCFT